MFNRYLQYLVVTLTVAVTILTNVGTMLTVNADTNITITIQAQVEWQNTGINLSPGQAVTIDATGLWSHGAEGVCCGPNPYDANGYHEKYDPYSLLPSARVGSLIGRIGGNAPFLVGTSTSFKTTLSGTLELGMNDVPSFFGDNSGNLTVHIQVGTATVASSSPQQFFSPGDNRVDPRPGDRVAVWCNQPDEIVVYGVDQSSHGFLLTTFSNSAVVAAGPSGLTKDVGANGTVSISEDNQGNFWLAWNSAKDKQCFSKGFQCKFQTTSNIATEGKAVDQNFFAAVLSTMGLPVNNFTLQVFKDWQQSEYTTALWNPLATTWNMPGSTDFNSVGVKNFATQQDGIQATAKTLNQNYYTNIRAMLAGKSFNPDGLRHDLILWSGNGAYINNLIATWKRLWDAR